MTAAVAPVNMVTEEEIPSSDGASKMSHIVSKFVASPATLNPLHSQQSYLKLEKHEIEGSKALLH